MYRLEGYGQTFLRKKGKLFLDQRSGATTFLPIYTKVKNFLFYKQSLEKQTVILLTLIPNF